MSLMLSASRWSRLIAALAVVVFGLAACEDEDKVVSPLKDIVPPSVTITSISHTAESLTVAIRAEDYITVAFIISEVSGGFQASDTLFTVGDSPTATLTTVYGFPAVTQNVNVTVTAIGVDSSGNRAERSSPYTITP